MSGSQPRVDVLLPCRNAGTTVEEAIGSLLAQRDVATRIIAIDDGSTDATPSVLKRLATKHTNIRTTRTPGIGIVGALNHGSNFLETDFVARLDADDVAHPERFAAQISLLESEVSLGVVGTQATAFPEDLVGEGLRLYLEWQNALVSTDDHARSIFIESPLCHPSTMMRRSAYENVGRYVDVSWAEDYDLWLRMHAAGYGIAKVPRLLTSWRRHDKQLTFTDPRYAKPEFRKARAHYLAPILRREARPIVMWGAGPGGKRLARELAQEGVAVARFVDIDPDKVGRTRQGKSVGDLNSLSPGTEKIVVAVGARGARGLIRDYLLARDFVETRDFILAS